MNSRVLRLDQRTRELTRENLQSMLVYFANSEQASIAVFTAMFCLHMLNII